MTLGRNTDVFGAEIFQLVSLHTPPDYVKQASVEDLVAPRPEAVTNWTYADPGVGDYPIHTPAATWASAARYYEKNAGDTEDVVALRIKNAAIFWGVKADVDAVITKAAADRTSDDSQLPDDAFAFVTTDGGRKERHLRLANVFEVKAAAAWLERYRDAFEYGDRREIARSILKKAAEYGVTEPLETVCRVAGLGSCSLSQAADLLTNRSFELRSRDAKLAGDLRAAATGLVEGLGCDDDWREKVATLVDQCDRATGLHVRYGDDVPRPEDVLFVVTEKMASDYQAMHLVTPTGTTYRTADLERLPLGSVRDHMGVAFADAVSDGVFVDAQKLAAVAATMPGDDADAFDRMAATFGVAVVTKYASASRRRPALAAMAAALS